MHLSRREIENIAKERIDLLVDLARHGPKPERYVTIAERIAMRMDITLPAQIKRSYCKKCKCPYDANTRIRIAKGIVTVRCSKCSDLRRIPY